MTKSACGHEFDSVCKVLDQLSKDTEKMAAKTFEGLLRHNHKMLQEAEKMGIVVEQGAKQLTQEVVSAREESKTIDPTVVVAVSNEMQKIKYSLDKIIGSVHTKVDEGVLFSDKAVVELKDFFSVVLDGLRQVHDLILTGNNVIVDYVVQRVEVYEEIGNKYAEEHQDRLIKGICLPKSSLIYLIILDSLKDILWYIRAIALAFKDKE